MEMKKFIVTSTKLDVYITEVRAESAAAARYLVQEMWNDGELEPYRSDWQSAETEV